jgi:hypothetical protein
MSDLEKRLAALLSAGNALLAAGELRGRGLGALRDGLTQSRYTPADEARAETEIQVADILFDAGNDAEQRGRKLLKRAAGKKKA